MNRLTERGEQSGSRPLWWSFDTSGSVGTFCELNELSSLKVWRNIIPGMMCCSNTVAIRTGIYHSLPKLFIVLNWFFLDWTLLIQRWLVAIVIVCLHCWATVATIWLLVSHHWWKSRPDFQAQRPPKIANLYRLANAYSDDSVSHSVLIQRQSFVEHPGRVRRSDEMLVFKQSGGGFHLKTRSEFSLFQWRGFFGDGVECFCSYAICSMAVNVDENFDTRWISQIAPLITINDYTVIIIDNASIRHHTSGWYLLDLDADSGSSKRQATGCCLFLLSVWVRIANSLLNSDKEIETKAAIFLGTPMVAIKLSWIRQHNYRYIDVKYWNFMWRAWKNTASNANFSSVNRA